MYRANESGQRVDIETRNKEVWCAKLGDYVEMNDNPCMYFRPREGGDDRDEL